VAGKKRGSKGFTGENDQLSSQKNGNRGKKKRRRLCEKRRHIQRTATGVWSGQQRLTGIPDLNTKKPKDQGEGSSTQMGEGVGAWVRGERQKKPQFPLKHTKKQIGKG